MSCYTDLAEQLESKGVGTHLQNPELIIVSNSNPAMPDSNCFWVTKKEGKWYLGTFLPAIYQLPEAANIAGVCEVVFRSSEKAIWTIDTLIASQLNLRRLSDSEVDEFGFG